MKRFIEGEDRSQSTLLPECLDDYVADDNPVRVIEVSLLTDAFLDATGRTVGRAATGISDDARARLLAYPWPGNVRELRNVIERAVILCEGGLITTKHLSLDVKSVPAVFPSALVEPAISTTLPTVDVAERGLIRLAMAKSGSNKSKAARLLGLTRAQLRSRIEKHGLT